MGKKHKKHKSEKKSDEGKICTSKIIIKLVF